MKQALSLIILIFGIVLPGCAKNDPALYNGIYYAIVPDNFINQWQVKGDTITIIRLNPKFEIRGGVNDTSILKIHATIREGNAYNLYVEQLLGNRLGKSRFNILAINKDNNNIHYTSNRFIGESYSTLTECRHQKFLNPKDNLCFSLYTQHMLDSFHHFKNINDIDTLTVCQIIKELNANFQTNKVKIEKIAKYDMYLSSSTKELVNRTLINMRINPIGYTNEEFNAVFKSCKTLEQ